MRGFAALLGKEWYRATPLRRMSHGIDAVLLATALLLLYALQISPLTTSWLTLKVMLVMAYIAFALVALRTGAPGLRVVTGLAALFLFACIFLLGRTHYGMG
jgi:uncharacterized membrane protein SirB2